MKKSMKWNVKGIGIVWAVLVFSALIAFGAETVTDIVINPSGNCSQSVNFLGTIKSALGFYSIDDTSGMYIGHPTNPILIKQGKVDGIDISADVVLDTTDQTIAGTKTFSAIAFPNQALPPIKIGTNANRSSEAQVVIAKSLNDDDTGNGHAFSDSTVVTRSGTISYNSFDHRIVVSGANNYGHFAGFQAAPTFSGSGAIGSNYGYYSNPTLTDGIITRNYGTYIDNPTVTGGTMVDNYGIWIANQTAASVRNWALYSAGGLNEFIGEIKVDEMSAHTDNHIVDIDGVSFGYPETTLPAGQNKIATLNAGNYAATFEYSGKYGSYYASGKIIVANGTINIINALDTASAGVSTVKLYTHSGVTYLDITTSNTLSDFTLKMIGGAGVTPIAISTGVGSPDTAILTVYSTSGGVKCNTIGEALNVTGTALIGGALTVNSRIILGNTATITASPQQYLNADRSLLFFDTSGGDIVLNGINASNGGVGQVLKIAKTVAANSIIINNDSAIAGGTNIKTPSGVVTTLNAIQMISLVYTGSYWICEGFYEQ